MNDKFCSDNKSYVIRFIFDLKRLSDSEFATSRGMFCQNWGLLKVIVAISCFIVDLCLDASILGFW